MTVKNSFQADTLSKGSQANGPMIRLPRSGRDVGMIRSGWLPTFATFDVGEMLDIGLRATFTDAALRPIGHVAQVVKTPGEVDRLVSAFDSHGAVLVEEPAAFPDGVCDDTLPVALSSPAAMADTIAGLFERTEAVNFAVRSMAEVGIDMADWTAVFTFAHGIAVSMLNATRLLVDPVGLVSRHGRGGRGPRQRRQVGCPICVGFLRVAYWDVRRESSRTERSRRAGRTAGLPAAVLRRASGSAHRSGSSPTRCRGSTMTTTSSPPSRASPPGRRSVWAGHGG